MALTVTFLAWLAAALLAIIRPAPSICMALPNPEVDALNTFRQGLSDPNNVLASWDPDLVDPCTWNYITCNADNKVTRLEMGLLNLSGHLVCDLQNLQQLQYMELYKNNFQGSIPEAFGNLTNLISLSLYNNNLTGSIPTTLENLKSLEFLRLNDNHLTGRIPSGLAKLPNLKVIDLSHNNLCGTIPTSGPFEHIPLNSFENNPRLEGPELQGLVAYDMNC